MRSGLDDTYFLIYSALVLLILPQSNSVPVTASLPASCLTELGRLQSTVQAWSLESLDNYVLHMSDRHWRILQIIFPAGALAYRFLVSPRCLCFFKAYLCRRGSSPYIANRHCTGHAYTQIVTVLGKRILRFNLWSVIQAPEGNLSVKNLCFWTDGLGRSSCSYVVFGLITHTGDIFFGDRHSNGSHYLYHPDVWSSQLTEAKGKFSCCLRIRLTSLQICRLRRLRIAYKKCGCISIGSRRHNSCVPFSRLSTRLHSQTRQIPVAVPDQLALRSIPKITWEMILSHSLILFRLLNATPSFHFRSQE